MQGKRKGVATQIRRECPAAVQVHCMAQSLNLCLQDAGRQITLLRNALDIVREIAQLIKFSPRRSHLFTEKLSQSDGSGVGIKPLCTTRWTARTSAIEAVLKDYSILMDTMEEVNHTTHDEYGLRAKGILTTMEKFENLFGLKLGYLLFSAAEEVSKCLQAKNTSLQEALSAVNLASGFFKRQRTDEAFNVFYDGVLDLATKLYIGSPHLPRYRRAPARLDDGSAPHQFDSPRSYYRSQYFQACDLLIGELEERFDQKELQPVLAMEELILKAANSEEFSDSLKSVEDSMLYATDLDFNALRRHLPLLHDVVKEALPEVRQVSSICTVCEAMNKSSTYKSILSEVHKVLRLYLTVPITSATSERTFSAMKRLLTYLRSTMTEKRLNNCVLLHIHKELTDELDLIYIAKEFIKVNSDRERYFGSFNLDKT